MEILSVFRGRDRRAGNYGEESEANSSYQKTRRV